MQRTLAKPWQSIRKRVERSTIPPGSRTRESAAPEPLLDGRAPLFFGGVGVEAGRAARAESELRGSIGALVERFFSPGGARARAEVEERIRDLVRFATGRDVRVIVYRPAARMQLKEARIHVRWPGASGVEPLAQDAEHVPRLADLERAYRELLKFYVFAHTDEPEILRKLAEVAEGEFPGATNLYRVGVS